MGIGYWNPLALNSLSPRFVLAAETDYPKLYPFKRSEITFRLIKSQSAYDNYDAQKIMMSAFFKIM